MLYIHISWQVVEEQGISAATARMNPAENFCVYFSSDAPLSSAERIRSFIRQRGWSFQNSVIRSQSDTNVRCRCLIFRIARMRTDSSFSLGCGRARVLSIPGVM